MSPTHAGITSWYFLTDSVLCADQQDLVSPSCNPDLSFRISLARVTTELTTGLTIDLFDGGQLNSFWVFGSCFCITLFTCI